MTDLLLIRHAVNDWVADRLAGWTPGVHLNDKGRGTGRCVGRTAGRVAHRSDLQQPAGARGGNCAGRGRAARSAGAIEEGVGESRYGDWTGQSIKELAKTPEWLTGAVRPQPGPLSQRRGAGRDAGPCRGRYRAAATAHPKGVIAVVSHADVIKAIAAHYAGMPFDLFQRLVIDTASVTWFRFTPHGPRLLKFNDTGSLEPPKPETGSDSQAALADAEKPDGGSGKTERNKEGNKPWQHTILI